MRRAIKSIIALGICIFVFGRGIVDMIGSLAQGRDILSIIPRDFIWQDHITDFILLACLIVFLAYDRIAAILHPIRIDFIGVKEKKSPFISAKIINRGKNELRVESTRMLLVHNSGKTREIKARRFTKCDGLKSGSLHVMAAGSNFSIEFELSSGIINSFNNSSDTSVDEEIKHFFVILELEDGTKITSRRIKARRGYKPLALPESQTELSVPHNPAPPQKPPSQPPAFGDIAKEIAGSDAFKRQNEMFEHGAKVMSESIRLMDASREKVNKKEESPLRIELDRNNRDPHNHIRATIFNVEKTPLKIHAIKLIGVWPSKNESIQDHPGLLHDETEPPCELSSEDRRMFIFAFTDSEIWRRDTLIQEYYVELELRNGSIYKSETIKRPSANPDTTLANKFKWSRIATAMEDRAVEIRERLVPRGDWSAVGTELTISALEDREPNLPEVHCIESDLIADANTANRDTGWSEFREMAIQAEKLNGQINAYNQALKGREITERTLESLVEMLRTPENILAQVVKMRAKIASQNI